VLRDMSRHTADRPTTKAGKVMFLTAPSRGLMQLEGEYCGLALLLLLDTELVHAVLEDPPCGPEQIGSARLVEVDA
jgi:hypothetical protein